MTKFLSVDPKSVGSIVLKVFCLVFLIGALSISASATEIESGYVQAGSTGTVSENVGFRPDYIEFISAQQIESPDFTGEDSENNDCPDNVNGWSEGSVIFDDSGVDKQFSIGMFRNSDNTNGHITASSTSHVIRNVYSDQDGNECGRLEISVSGVLSNGFEVNVENKYSHYDEIVRYKAYQFPDNMEFDAGMVEISSSNTGSVDVDSLGFQPANLHIRAGQQITSKNSVSEYWRDPAGRSKGYATLEGNGNVIDQQSIGTASSSDSTNRHRSLASDQHVLNTVYVNQDGNVLGRLEGAISGADGGGFTMNIEENSYGSDEIFLYRAWGSSYYEYDVGYKVIGSQGTHSFSTSYQGESFEPDAIDIYAEQQISSINDEVVTGNNNGCDNAGGWSNGYYETKDDYQWAISTGRTSASQNTHRYGATNVEALQNLYHGGNPYRGRCGYFTGEVTGTNSNGFNMDFNFDTDFENNYGEEMVYYRALKFLLAPPRIKGVGLNNSSVEHEFGVTANISEGSNDVESCEIEAEDGEGNVKRYDGTINKVNETFARCIYNNVTYDDNSDWESRHDQDGDLLNLDVKVIVEDIDGQRDIETVGKRFPNHNISITGLNFTNYSEKQAFNVSANVTDLDDAEDEVRYCGFRFEDQDGNVVNKFDHSPEVLEPGHDRYRCLYSNVDSSMPLGSDRGDGFEPLEEIDVRVNTTDGHGKNDTVSGSNVIPNSKPVIKDIFSENYSRRHAFNVTAIVEDDDSYLDEIKECRFNFSDGKGNHTVKYDSSPVNFGSNPDRYRCFYSNVNSSMPWKSSKDDGFRPLEEINISVRAWDSGDSSDNMSDSNPVPNSVPRISLENPDDKTLWTDDQVILNVTAEDPDVEDDNLTARFFNDSNGNLLGRQHHNYTENSLYHSDVWGDLELGDDHFWRVNVSDSYQNGTEVFQFLRASTRIYQAQTEIAFEYSSLIMAGESQRDFFMTVKNRIDENKDLKTYLAGVNASFPEYGANLTPEYTLEPFSEKRFLVRVDPESTGRQTLNVTTENVNIQMNSTDSIPVLVRNRAPGADPEEVPGIETLHLLFVVTFSTILYFSSL